MRPPRIPPLVADIVQAAISAVDGVVFTEHSKCPACGGSLAGYDTKRRQFARIVTEDGPRTVYVDIRRFYCRDCHRLCFADNPFYPDTRIGSIVIDLCIALSMTIRVNRVPTYLAAMGILVNRSSCRLYVQNNSGFNGRTYGRSIGTNNLFGFHLPLSVFSLAALAADPVEGSHIEGADVCAACGFPSAQRMAPDRLLPLEQLIVGDEPEKRKWQVCPP